MLYVLSGDEAAICAAVTAAYEAIGLVVVPADADASDDTNTTDHREPDRDEPEREAPATTLARDEVAVFGLTDAMTGVLSRRLTLTPVGRHPLALALSQRFAVVAAQGRAGRFSEVALYRDGRLAELDVRGPETPAGPTAEPLAFDRLAVAIDAPPTLLETLRPDFERFRAAAGFDLESFADTALDGGAVLVARRV